jgi:hypothetical protein
MAATILSGLGQVWPWGALEILEFTMHTLRWDEVRATLQHHAESGSDFRTRDMARSALQAFEDEWPGGEIYRRYRSD